jgi:hypothetical protein
MRKSLVAQMAEELPESDATPFERFRDLTRRLVAVPKSEVVEMEDAEKRAKTAKSASRPLGQ